MAVSYNTSFITKRYLWHFANNVSLLLHPSSVTLRFLFCLRWIVLVWLQTSQSLVTFHYSSSSCACCFWSDPGHYCGNGPGGPERDALGQGRSSSVVSDENRRVSEICELQHSQAAVNNLWESVRESTLHSGSSFSQRYSFVSTQCFYCSCLNNSFVT